MGYERIVPPQGFRPTGPTARTNGVCHVLSKFGHVEGPFDTPILHRLNKLPDRVGRLQAFRFDREAVLNPAAEAPLVIPSNCPGTSPGKSVVLSHVL